jgi:hypothetical protein
MIDARSDRNLFAASNIGRLIDGMPVMGCKRLLAVASAARRHPLFSLAPFLRVTARPEEAAEQGNYYVQGVCINMQP